MNQKIQIFLIEFLEFAKCWSPKERLHETNMCIDKHIIQLEYISKQIAPEWQIPAICCTYYQRHDCIKREIGKICDKKNVKYVMQIIDDSTRDITKFSCGPYTSTHVCNRKFNASVWLTLKDIVNTNDEILLASRHKYKSGIAPTVAIITHFEI